MSSMRGIDTPVKQTRRRVFKEVANLAYHSQNLKDDMEALPYKIVDYEESVFWENTPGQPPVRMDAVSVLPPSDHLCLFRHCPAHIRVIPGGPQFILIHLIRGKGGAVDDFPPGPERAVLHADPLIVIEKARQGVIRVLGVSPYVHGPLGGVIAVKFLLFYFDPLLWLNSFVCLPSS